ncbi:MAG: hypothetical protein O2958_12950 [Gemmatimonadetes bacterium]|nr:hypothetical protein [Gemmatimonadota bacterium]MDA1103676.1 hypothetical protein [Gemmatimonadota bacterium]
MADVWQSYLATIRSVRAGDERRYATAYEAALDDAAVDGEVRVTRLNAALANFSSGAALRSAHYDRVEALATAAIQSHNALVEAEGLFIFDATGTSGGRGSLGRGVSGRDADSQLLLDQVLSLLSGALEAGGLGPREGSNVRSWVWDGLLGAVAN